MKLVKENVLFIGDTHEPFCREGYLEFCKDMQKKYGCGLVVHAGDEVDNYAVSDYDSDVSEQSAGGEYIQALEKMKLWYKAFPNVSVCIGNHSDRIFRRANAAGIPKKMMKSYEQIWEAPKGWIWADSWDINNVHFTHGTNTSGPSAALKRAVNLRKSVAIGHLHKECGIQYNVSSVDAIWGLIVGCGIDDKTYAFRYAQDQVKKSIISCAVIVDNGRIPIIELMPL